MLVPPDPDPVVFSVFFLEYKFLIHNSDSLFNYTFQHMSLLNMKTSFITHIWNIISQKQNIHSSLLEKRQNQNIFCICIIQSIGQTNCDILKIRWFMSKCLYIEELFFEYFITWHLIIATFGLIKGNNLTHFSLFYCWRRSVSLYTLYAPRSRKWMKFFLGSHMGPQPPKIPSKLIFDLLGGPWGPFFKKI